MGSLQFQDSVLVFTTDEASLDVSKNTALSNLECSSNQLTSLDVSGCTALTRVECYSNQTKRHCNGYLYRKFANR